MEIEAAPLHRFGRHGKSPRITVKARSIRTHSESGPKTAKLGTHSTGIVTLNKDLAVEFASRSFSLVLETCPPGAGAEFGGRKRIFRSVFCDTGGHDSGGKW